VPTNGVAQSCVRSNALLEICDVQKWFFANEMGLDVIFQCAVDLQHSGELQERVQQVNVRHMALSNRLLTSFRFVDALEGKLAAQT
jgi:hypothetical protein